MLYNTKQYLVARSVEVTITTKLSHSQLFNLTTHHLTNLHAQDQHVAILTTQPPALSSVSWSLEPLSSTLSRAYSPHRSQS